MVFGQVAVEDKSNEITANPNLKGAVVTIDAMGTQRPFDSAQGVVAKAVVEGGGDYLLPAKGNQETLHAKVKAMPDDAVAGPVAGLAVGYFKEEDDDHGRLETRETWVVGEVHWLPKGLLDRWPGLATGSLMMTQRTRQDLTDLTGKITVEDHYYISSLAGQARGPRCRGPFRRTAGPATA
jgi:predicted transposase YbfD/YdcC